MKKTHIRIQQAVSALLLIAAIGIAGWLSTQYKLEFDWTANQRNTLTEASVKQLGNMKEPVKVLAFATSGAENRAEIEQFFGRYRKAKPDLVIEYIDPIKQPNQVREYNISSVGDLVIEYQGRRETVRAGEMNETTVTPALQRLSFAEERWLVFLQGHGEHDAADQGGSGYGQFVQLLHDNGLKTQPLNLATTPRIPDNAAALVVAGPVSPLTAGETQVLVDYVQQGGNLLWLSDPDTPPPPPPLAKLLGTQFQQGTAIFPEFAALGGDPSLFITASYPRTPITAELRENTAFPLVRGIGSDDQAKPVEGQLAFKPQPFLQTTPDAWLETGALSGEIGFEAEQGDQRGPLTLGLLLSRSVQGATAAGAATDAKPPERQQRVVLLGDSDFLANSFVGQLGNAKLGLNLARWLASRDDQLDITIPAAQDQSLDLSPMAALAIQLAFLLLIPLALLAIGIGRWLSRRRR
ncbi:MAG: GldG family protein [Stagnimonas sp.]|nr:GldG family protein [Stagnimonas sp.]